MIYINNLSISNDNLNLNVNVTTNVGSTITKVLLWNENTFKDYSQAVDISFKLEQVNNNEIFILENTEININEFTGIYFLEFTTDYEEPECSNCLNTVIGIAANFNNVKSFILDKVLNLNVCNTCPNNYDNIIYADLTLNGLTHSLQLGYYDEAIFLYNKLKKLLGSDLNCKNCKKLRTPSYNNSLNFGILNNSLILI